METDGSVPSQTLRRCWQKRLSKSDVFVRNVRGNVWAKRQSKACHSNGESVPGLSSPLLNGAAETSGWPPYSWGATTGGVSVLLHRPEERNQKAVMYGVSDWAPSSTPQMWKKGVGRRSLRLNPMALPTLVSHFSQILNYSFFAQNIVFSWKLLLKNDHIPPFQWGRPEASWQGRPKVGSAQACNSGATVASTHSDSMWTSAFLNERWRKVYHDARHEI